MDKHIDEFKTLFPNFNEIFSKLKSLLNNDELEINNLIKDPEKLFIFAFTNNLLEIVIFLYQYQSIPYNEKLLTVHSVDDPKSGSIDKSPILDSTVVMSDDNIKTSNKDGGSYGGSFNPCIAYLYKMRKYSARTFIKGVGGIYTINPKYILILHETPI